MVYYPAQEQARQMSLISTRQLGKSFGSLDLFSDISISIPRRARIGLVGANGVGKTTLLRILLGMETPSSGAVHRARDLHMGFLPQEAALTSSRSLWEESMQVFADLQDRQAELNRLETSMGDASMAGEVLQTYSRLQSEFEHLGGYTYEQRIRQTLSGLGFDSDDLQCPVNHLSGGQRTRVCLAKLLLENPDLLFLDEPTNHLDIQAIEWLEAFLREWPGASVIVSHDRYFLDQTVSTIWEMTPRLEVYRGNYTAFLDQRDIRNQQRLQEYRSRQEHIAKEEEYIRRNIAGQNTRQAQGRRKRLERLMDESTLTPPPRSPRRLHLDLGSAGRSGDLVLRTFGLQIGYPGEGRPLYQVPDLTLLRGECAAVLGPNGAGKTTLLKTLLGQVPPYAGEAILGSSLQIGYFAQAHEDLHPEFSLMQEIESIAPNMLPAEARDYLAKFLFTGDDVFKTVETLSGGERGRLALALLALQGSNLLLLDEPTNHLDLPSQDALQAVLRNFQGTTLLVTHDRYLIDALATQVWEVLPAAEELKVFAGTYSEYRAILRGVPDAAPAPRPPLPGEKAVGKKEPTVRPSSTGKHNRQRRQLKLDALEETISSLEEQLAAISRQLEDPPADGDAVQRLGREYVQLESRLETRLQEWISLMEGE